MRDALHGDLLPKKTHNLIKNRYSRPAGGKRKENQA
jgi:hypothetical protein